MFSLYILLILVETVTTTRDPYCDSVCSGNKNIIQNSNGNRNCNCGSSGFFNGNFNFSPRTTTEYVNKDITFPENGLTQFSIDVPADTTSITLSVSYPLITCLSPSATGGYLI